MGRLLIVSKRAFEHWPSYDLVYEWEDEIVKVLLTADIYKQKKITIWKKSVNCKINGLFDVNRLFTWKKMCFRYDMEPVLHGKVSSNMSICIIDFYLNESDLSRFYKVYNNVQHLYVSSREVYDFLQSHSPQRLVEHLPLTLPDKYAISENTLIEKQYDLVMVGRQNSVLMDFLAKYMKDHKISCVIRGEITNGHFPYYTDTGEFVGYGDTRSQYIGLLRKGRVAFYSTPGMDGGETRTNGFNQVTPRFLEEIACGCNVIARYTKNSDTDYFELDKMCQKVDRYEDFENAMNFALNNSPNMKLYSTYLKKHYTSTIATRLV